MRFLTDGPQLPDELLVACDEGRVLFFCGAGVSRAKANLPDFLGLAARVLNHLHVLPESPARKLVDAAAALKPIAGVGGLVSADRIFGLLEREFSTSDIVRAVGHSLRPPAPVDLSPHTALLRLSRNSENKIRIVTTNFDLLFEAASPRSKVWTPNNLPDPRGMGNFEGIVHLHGIFDSTYDNAVDGHLVLSSAEFGRAYLAEGWATDFIRSIIRSYFIVFVGYAGDDPPVQYLLEALRQTTEGEAPGLYAFQAGRDQDAQALWTQKGVKAIPYGPADNHSALWETLSAWADRARSPAIWREKKIRRARRGPHLLTPVERGQIVHLACTEDGAKTILASDPPLPAAWLNVFDPSSRYGKNLMVLSEGSANDPFLKFGLDNDPIPEPGKPSPFQQRDVPQAAVDALAPTVKEKRGIAGTLRGADSSSASSLPSRLHYLGMWLRRVCADPAAVWWAADQSGLHPSVIRSIEFVLDHAAPTIPDEARKCWRYLFESWKSPPDPNGLAGYGLKQALKVEGWTKPLVRRYVEINRGSIQVTRPYSGAPSWQKGKKWPEIGNVLHIDVHHLPRHARIEIPDDQLAVIVPLVRKNLEYAIALYGEVSPYSLQSIPPIEPDFAQPGESSERDFGFNVVPLEFAALFKRLVAHDLAAARKEFASWPAASDPVFDRLRVWATTIAGLIDDNTAGAIITSLNDDVFWGMRAQRDLLLALLQRWQDFPNNYRVAIETRILRGPPNVGRVAASQNKIWSAVEILNRVTWLQDQGCSFATKTKSLVRKLRKVVPDWEPERAASAADSTEGRGGTVIVDQTYDQFLSVPVANLIESIGLGVKRYWGGLRDTDPFGGLCIERPVRVLAALRLADKADVELATFWVRFLQSGGRQKDSAKLSVLIAFRIGKLPDDLQNSILTPATYWLAHSAKTLIATNRRAYEEILSALMKALSRGDALAPPRESTEPRDWINEAFGSAAGQIVEVLFTEFDSYGLKAGGDIPAAWKTKVETLLSLPVPMSSFALFQIGRRLGRLHWQDRAWTGEEILVFLNTEGEQRRALLSGFLSSPNVYDEGLYALLRSVLFGEDAPGRRTDVQARGAFLVRGWLSQNAEGPRWLSNDEFRRAIILGDNDLRTNVLWHVSQFEKLSDKIEFLTSVWPLQMAVRSPVVVGRLCSIPFRDPANFKALVDVVIPLVSGTTGSGQNLSVSYEDQGDVTDQYPDEVLALLSTVLTDGASAWAYGIDRMVERIAEAKPSLAGDPRLIRLRADIAKA